MEDPLKKLIERRHPLYEEKLPHWNFLEATYEGGRSWFKDNIFRYVKEGEEEFEARLKRAYRFNHTREVVDLVDKYLFKVPISRKEEDAPESVKRFWAKSTRNGLDINSYVRRISRQTSTLGRHWIVVDSTLRAGEPTVEGTPAPVSKAEQGEAQIYSYIVAPQHMLDMSYDDDGDGELNWCLIHETKRDDQDPLTSTGEIRQRFRLWTRNDWTLFEARKEGRKTIVTRIDANVHDLGVVPVFPADCTISDEEYASPGLIEDVAYEDRAVANYLSNLDAIIQDQTFSQLAMPGQGLLPGESGYDKLIQMGTKRVFTFDGEGGAAPFYLSPDVKQAELIMKAIVRIISEIYHSVGLSAERSKDDNGGGVDNSSGVAKSMDFERTNSLLSSKADSLEHIENRLCRLVALWAGEDDEIKGDLVHYPENFDTRGLYDEFEIGARLSLLNAPEGVRREQMKLLIDKLFPAMSKVDRDKLDTELKSWPPEELLAGLGASGSGKPSGGPVAAAGAQKTAKEMTA